MKRVVRVLGDQDGVTAIEYGLVAALVAIAIVVGVAAFGLELQGLYQRICSAVSVALGRGAC